MQTVCGVSDHWESTSMYYSGIQTGWRVLITYTQAGNWQELIHEGAAQNVNGVAFQDDYGFFFPVFSKIS